ncbi:MAG: hypothetical protein JWQ34_866 [Mucilaginibacter sp.]|uniref:DUF4359 domain-containing protein n=1 Tax=Mucilaginibacter sp. TaxID=1882438 RepID=UPI002625FD5D|nr:DUF4359 domain-containing protein [Mucilaginibacter sp.]MDB5002641.1 hypothetical protein [Mucilaginibacter sp.]
MKKSYLTLIVILLILSVAIFTNPNLARHKEVVKTELNMYMQKAVKDEMKGGRSEMIGQAFGALLGGALVDRMIDSIVSTDNYLIFSTTKVTWEGKSRVIGIGIFGNVYITGKLKEAMAQNTSVDNSRP